MKNICIYSKKELNKEDLSKEHIIPAALGCKETIYISKSINNNFSNIEESIIDGYFRHFKVNNKLSKRGRKDTIKTNLIIIEVDGDELLGFRDSNNKILDDELEQVLFKEMKPVIFQGKNNISTEEEAKKFLKEIKNKLESKEYKICEFLFKTDQIIILKEENNKFLIIAIQHKYSLKEEEYISKIIENISEDKNICFKNHEIKQKNNINCKETLKFDEEEMKWFIAKTCFNILCYLTDTEFMLNKILDPLRNFILKKNTKQQSLESAIELGNIKENIKFLINNFVKLGILNNENYSSHREKNKKLLEHKIKEKTDSKHILFVYKNGNNLEGIFKIFEDYHHIIFTDKFCEDFKEKLYFCKYN